LALNNDRDKIQKYMLLLSQNLLPLSRLPPLVIDNDINNM